MSDKEIIGRLREIVRNNSPEERDWEQINADTTIESLGFDSLSILDLLYDVGQEFGVEIEASEVLDTRTVGEIAELLKRHQS